MRRLVLLLSLGSLLGCPGDDSMTSDTASTQTGSPTTGPSTDTDGSPSTDATGPGMTMSGSGSTGADSGSGSADTVVATSAASAVLDSIRLRWPRR